METSIRFDKSELAIESIRLLHWEARKKRMLIVALVHASLLSLLAHALDGLRTWLLLTGCHRTDERSALPRLRSIVYAWSTAPFGLLSGLFFS